MIESSAARRRQYEHYLVGVYYNLRSATLWLDGMRRVTEFRAREYEFSLGPTSVTEISLRLGTDPDSPLGIWVAIPQEGVIS